MHDPGKVQGERLLELFKQLIEKKIIISMNVVGTGFQRLTCIVDIQEDPKGHMLQVDLPEGFAAAADGKDVLHLRFNFNGPDQLEYIFSTRGGTYGGGKLLIPLPDHVERLQRRKDFRMDVPPGTRLLFQINKIKGIISLINISMGGAFGALVKHNGKDIKGPLLKIDQVLYNAGIMVPASKETAEVIIIIEKAQVRRIEHDKERNIYKFAFQFIGMAKEEKKKLTQAIYSFQRQFLQNR